MLWKCRSVTLRAENRLRIFQGNVLRVKIGMRQDEEVTRYSYT
jgi:hypothetical protein